MYLYNVSCNFKKRIQKLTIKEETRKNILRIHGSILIVIGIALTVNATIGTYLGVGKFNFLKDNELALVGLFQLRGLTDACGSNPPRLRSTSTPAGLTLPL